MNKTKLKLSRESDKGSFISFPLTIRKKTIGVMNINRTTKQASFNEDDLDKISGIAVLIASLIDKETLLERVETNRKEISALYQMSNLLSESNDFKGRLEEFLSKLSKELGMKRSAVIKAVQNQSSKNGIDKREQKLEIIAAHHLKESQLEEMFKSASDKIRYKLLDSNSYSNTNNETPLTLLFDDGNEISEMYCIPLFVVDEGLYFLIVSRSFIENDEAQAKKHYRFLQVISHNLSSAITRERMLKTIHEDKEILKESAERNKIFFEISKDLGSTLDPYMILQKAFNQFNKIISFTTISILLYDDLDTTYKLIVQPSEPISLKYQKKLTESIFRLFREYPSEPAFDSRNFSKPTFFNPQNPNEKQVSLFRHVLHLPIILGNGVQGLIHLARKGGAEFTSHELDITSQFTGIFITSLTVIPALFGHYAFSVAAAGIYVVHAWCLFLVSKNEKNAMFRILNSTAGYFLFTIPVVMIAWVYQRDPILFLYLVLVTKISDIGAYVTGTVSNALTKGGNHKLIPSISPGKSYEGAVGGLISAVAASFIIWPHCGLVNTLWFPAAAGVVLFFGSMAGDLSESAFKRTCQIKDSGNFLPGIGGIFDLVDSLLVNGVLFFLFLFLFMPA